MKSEITQNIGHYAVQRYTKSPILVLMESLYATSYVSIIVTYCISYNVTEIWRFIDPVVTVDRVCFP